MKIIYWDKSAMSLKNKTSKKGNKSIIYFERINHSNKNLDWGQGSYKRCSLSLQLPLKTKRVKSRLWWIRVKLVWRITMKIKLAVKRKILIILKKKWLKKTMIWELLLPNIIIWRKNLNTFFRLKINCLNFRSRLQI